MPKIDVPSIPQRQGSNYPQPFDAPLAGRVRRRLGDAGGLTQFGVNLMHLAPGAWSSQRHWHAKEDEFVYVLAGELVLVTDEGEQVLRAGDCAAFPCNVGNAHHLVNRSDAPATCLEVGTRHGEDQVVYPDIDLRYDGRLDAYLHRDGTPYAKP